MRIVIVYGSILGMRRIRRGGSWRCLGRILEWHRRDLEGILGCYMCVYGEGEGGSDGRCVNSVVRGEIPGQ